MKEMHKEHIIAIVVSIDDVDMLRKIYTFAKTLKELWAERSREENKFIE